MKIEKHIHELLLWHDCVIIPGFGGFITNYLPAQINNSKHLFTPPSKNITFNKNLKNNDGLLANHIAISENITFYKAVSLIEESVSISFENLNKGKQISIKGIGKFYFDKEQNIQFEPLVEINLLVGSFGLTEFHSPLITREPLHKKIEKKFKDRPAVGGDRKSKLKKWGVTLAALPILAAMAWLPLKTDLFYNLSVNYSSLIPSVFVTESTFSPRNEEFSFNLIGTTDELDVTALKVKGEEKSFKEEITAPITKELVRETPVSVTETAPAENSNNFYVIAGCFGVIENAQKMVSELNSKGYNAQIVDKNKGLYRVCYKGFKTKDEAIDLLVNVKNSENASAWILSN